MVSLDACSGHEYWGIELRAAEKNGRLLVAAVIASVALVLTGCAGAASGDGQASAAASQEPTAAPEVGEADELLAPHGLSGLDARQVIDELEATPVAERPKDLMASVQPDELVLSNAQGEEARLPMPEDEFYVSVAPYAEATHECHFHSLTTCLGELSNEPIGIEAEVVGGENAAGGAWSLAEQRKTADNGFAGVWLPRDREIALRITHEDGVAERLISTGEPDAPTCITTMRLDAA